MTTRLVHLQDNLDEWVVNRVAEGSKEWSVLIISTRHPAERLLDMIENAGGDLEHVFVFDTISQFAPTSRQGNVYAGFNLERIETLAARANKIARTEGQRNVLLVLDYLDALANVMGPTAMMELAGRVVNSMKLPSNQFDWVYAELDESYLGPLKAFVNATVEG